MAVPKRTSKSKQINEKQFGKNRMKQSISQSVIHYIQLLKRLETADVSLDQNHGFT
jgi:hypothetical protein